MSEKTQEGVESVKKTFDQTSKGNHRQTIHFIIKSEDFLYRYSRGPWGEWGRWEPVHRFRSLIIYVG